MRRREFITLLGGATVARPLAARAQQPAMPVVGFISDGSPDSSGPRVTAFRKGLNETGYVEGQSVTVEYHWLEGHYDRIPALAADLVRRRVAVIAAPGTPSIAVAVNAATATIPIVFGVSQDPVQLGLVASLARPGGNATGVNFFKVQEAAPAIGLQIQIVNATTIGEIDAVFASLARERSDALFVGGDGLFSSRTVQFAAMTAREGIPATFANREFVVAGGLMSYGTNIADMYRQVGVYTGTILKGAKPADLPVVQSTKFEFVINLQTARALGIEVPPAVFSIADEVIE
jgi:putative tryptophan/tyrosine transport system substrate-binding protein